MKVGCRTTAIRIPLEENNLNLKNFHIPNVGFFSVYLVLFLRTAKYDTLELFSTQSLFVLFLYL